MTIITNRVNNSVIYIGTQTGKTLAGYLIMDENKVFMPKFVCSYIKDEIPQEVLNEPNRYCYDEVKGFYDFVEPSPDMPEEIKESIRQEYRDELAQEVSQNVYDA